MMISQSDSPRRQFCAIVPAAGVGKRMAADRPKQYLKIGSKTLLEWTLERLITHPLIHHIILPVHPDDAFVSTLTCYNAPWLTVVHGGNERADSVLAGLQAMPDNNNAQQDEIEWVLVHDAARPCVSHRDISQLLRLAEVGQQGGILACPVRDTMKRAAARSPTVVSRSEPREHLWHALTPQFFPKQQLQTALATALQEGATITDEASAIERRNGIVHLVEGQASNIKVTRPDDLLLAEFYLTTPAIQQNPISPEKKMSPSPSLSNAGNVAIGFLRTGQGYDVHKFGGAGPIVIGGEIIEHDQGLLAHSDGDVLLHAICDALLGALALRDIGYHFPDTDAKYQNANSRDLLKQVITSVHEKGFEINNLDCTIVAQAPKMSPHIERMRSNIAHDCQCTTEQINVKATTTEKLGFAGRKEGIACYASVLLITRALTGLANNNQ